MSEKVETKEETSRRLSKRLSYVLRYGAVAEGLDVDSHGFVALSQLLTIDLMKEYAPEELLAEVKASMSYRNKPRFEYITKDYVIYVRATYLRNFEKSQFHKDTKVKTLMESSMTCILNNLDLYDLENFPDEYTIKLMIRRLKRQKAINNKTLSVLLVPTLTRIDLEDIYLTNNTLRMLWTQCPHLKAISLKHCGYIVTDTILTQLVKNLPNLEELNLTQCKHLTEKSLAILSKRLPRLKSLRIAGVRSINPNSVHTCLMTAQALTFLDVFFMRTTKKEYYSLMKCAKEHNVELALRHPKDRKSSDEHFGSVHDENIDCSVEEDTNYCSDDDFDDGYRDL